MVGQSGYKPQLAQAGIGIRDPGEFIRVLLSPAQTDLGARRWAGIFSMIKPVGEAGAQDKEIPLGEITAPLVIGLVERQRIEAEPRDAERQDHAADRIDRPRAELHGKRQERRAVTLPR